MSSGLHQCPFCDYRFEDPESLHRHLGEGDGCPEKERFKQINELLAEHRYVFGRTRDPLPDYCSCGEWKATTLNLAEAEQQWRVHVAAKLSQIQ